MIAALAVATCWALAPARAAGLDPAQMSADEIKSLEQRLTDAGCYNGAIDGHGSDALDAAIMACPDQRPFLRIETGMHTALIARIGVDAACSLLATASTDKTVRLWSLPDGKLQRVIRLPIGDGWAGRVNATALSSDGRLLGVGGVDAAYNKTGKHSLTIVDLSNGAIRRFGAFEDAVATVAFSADGRRVAVGLGGENGMRVLDSATGVELFADRHYGGTVGSLAFAPDGSIVVSSDDGQLRRYGPDLKLTAKRSAPDGKDPFGVAIDPSGRRVAIGYGGDSPRVSMLDAKTLVPVGKTQTGDLLNGTLGFVAWSRDSATLVAGGTKQFAQGKWRGLLRRFDSAGRRQGADVDVSDSTIWDIQPCGEGFAFATGDPSFGVLSTQGVTTVLQGPRTPDMLLKLEAALAVSPDGSSVRFGLGQGDSQPVVFDLAAASLTDSPALPPGLAPPQVNGLPVSNWQMNFAPKFHGATLAAGGHMSLSLAIRPGASGSARRWVFPLMTRRATSSGIRTARASHGASISPPTARLSPSPMAMARSAGCAGATARNCLRCSSSRRAVNGSPGRQAAITWHPPAARI
jgi:WD40 repeat protein